MNDGNINSCS